MTKTLAASSANRPVLSSWLFALPLPLLEAGLVLAWSSGFIGARFSLDYAPALLVVFWRCVLVSVVLLPWVIGPLRKASWAVLLRNLGIGLLAMAGYLGGVVQGIALGVPAGIAALFADLLPIGTALLGSVLLGHTLTRQVAGGLIIGLAGVLLVTHDALAFGQAPWWAYSLPLLGMFSLALATVLQKRCAPAQTLGLLPNLWLQCAVSGVVFAVAAGSQHSLLPIPSTGFVLSVLWTATVSTLGGYGLYWICLRRASATRVASVLYLSPAVTLVGAWTLFDDPLSWLMAAGTLVSALGVWRVVRAEGTDRSAS